MSPAGAGLFKENGGIDYSDGKLRKKKKSYTWI
jgi:hypothetical protein